MEGRHGNLILRPVILRESRFHLDLSGRISHRPHHRDCHVEFTLIEILRSLRSLRMTQRRARNDNSFCHREEPRWHRDDVALLLFVPLASKALLG